MAKKRIADLLIDILMAAGVNGSTDRIAKVRAGQGSR